MKYILFLFGIFSLPIITAYYATNGSLSISPSSLGFGFLGISFITYGISLLIHTSISRIILTILSVIALIIGWLDAICLYMTHKSFDFIFMFHLNIDTFRFMTSTQIIMMIIISIITSIFAYILYRIYNILFKEIDDTALYIKILLIIIGFICLYIFDTPYKDLIHYFERSYARHNVLNLSNNEMIKVGIKPCDIEWSDLQAIRGKNLIFIYLESIDSSFLDEEIFPNLCPNMNKLRKESIVFDNITPAFHADYSFGGMYASMVGSQIVTSQMPSIFERNSGVKNNFGDRLISFPTILSKAGYYQEYICGASGKFAGVEEFIRREHYDEYIQPNTSHGAGCYDDELFTIAFEEYLKLSKMNKPFNITMFTLDTHVGGYTDPSWKIYDTKNISLLKKYNDGMLTSVHHTDKALGLFIDKLKNTPEWSNTVVFIMNDHYCWPGEYKSVLESSKNRRMNIFALNTEYTTINRTKGKTYDIAPTVLDLLKVRHNYTFTIGESLLSLTNVVRLNDDTITREECLNAYLLKKSTK